MRLFEVFKRGFATCRIVDVAGLLLGEFEKPFAFFLAPWIVADGIEVLQQEIGVAGDAFRTMRIIFIGFRNILDGDGAAFLDVTDNILDVNGFRKHEIEGIDEMDGIVRIRAADDRNDRAFGNLLMILQDAVFGTTAIDDFNGVAVHFIKEMI